VRTSDVVGEIVAGLIAIVLIGADVWLATRGITDNALQASVPTIVAFYFGGRLALAAGQLRRSNISASSNGGGTTT